METVSEAAVEGTVKAVTCGGAVSVRMIVVDADIEAETVPEPSLAQAKKVFEPALETVWVVGAVAVQPEAEARGAEAVSVMR